MRRWRLLNRLTVSPIMILSLLFHSWLWPLENSPLPFLCTPNFLPPTCVPAFILLLFHLMILVSRFQLLKLTAFRDVFQYRVISITSTTTFDKICAVRYISLDGQHVNVFFFCSFLLLLLCCCWCLFYYMITLITIFFKIMPHTIL